MALATNNKTATTDSTNSNAETLAPTHTLSSEDECTLEDGWSECTPIVGSFEFMHRIQLDRGELQIRMYDLADTITQHVQEQLEEKEQARLEYIGQVVVGAEFVITLRGVPSGVLMEDEQVKYFENITRYYLSKAMTQATILKMVVESQEPVDCEKCLRRGRNLRRRSVEGRNLQQQGNEKAGSLKVTGKIIGSQQSTLPETHFGMELQDALQTNEPNYLTEMKLGLILPGEINVGRGYLFFDELIQLDSNMKAYNPPDTVGSSFEAPQTLSPTQQPKISTTNNNSVSNTDNTATKSASGSSQGVESTTWMYICIGAGIFLLIVLLLVTWFCCCRRKGRQRRNETGVHTKPTDNGLGKKNSSGDSIPNNICRNGTCLPADSQSTRETINAEAEFATPPRPVKNTETPVSTPDTQASETSQPSLPVHPAPLHPNNAKKGQDDVTMQQQEASSFHPISTDSPTSPEDPVQAERNSHHPELQTQDGASRYSSQQEEMQQFCQPVPDPSRRELNANAVVEDRKSVPCGNSTTSSRSRSEPESRGCPRAKSLDTAEAELIAQKEDESMALTHTSSDHGPLKARLGKRRSRRPPGRRAPAHVDSFTQQSAVEVTNVMEDNHDERNELTPREQSSSRLQEESILQQPAPTPQTTTPVADERISPEITPDETIEDMQEELPLNLYSTAWTPRAVPLPPPLDLTEEIARCERVRIEAEHNLDASVTDFIVSSHEKNHFNQDQEPPTEISNPDDAHASFSSEITATIVSDSSAGSCGGKVKDGKRKHAPSSRRNHDNDDSSDWGSDDDDIVRKRDPSIKRFLNDDSLNSSHSSRLQYEPILAPMPDPELDLRDTGRLVP